MAKGRDFTASDLVRLGGQPSRCAGTVELRHAGQWRPAEGLYNWIQKKIIWNYNATAAVCRQLQCGSAVSERIKNYSPVTPVWKVPYFCVAESSSLRDCVIDEYQPDTGHGMEVVCSDLLLKPNMSLSAEADGVFQAEPQGVSVLWGSDFSVRCSTEPQFPGGFFQLLSPFVDPAQSNILPADNHSALFLFSDAGPAHKGHYTCVYHLQVFSHNFSSQSHTLHISLWETNNHYWLLLIPSGMLVVCILCAKIKSKNAQNRNSGINLMIPVYGNIGQEQTIEDATYQSLCPETMDNMYEELHCKTGGAAVVTPITTVTTP